VKNIIDERTSAIETPRNFIIILALSAAERWIEEFDR